MQNAFLLIGIMILLMGILFVQYDESLNDHDTCMKISEPGSWISECNANNVALRRDQSSWSMECIADPVSTKCNDPIMSRSSRDVATAVTLLSVVLSIIVFVVMLVSDLRRSFAWFRQDSCLRTLSRPLSRRRFEPLNLDEHLNRQQFVASFI